MHAQANLEAILRRISLLALGDNRCIYVVCVVVRNLVEERQRRCARDEGQEDEVDLSQDSPLHLGCDFETRIELSDKIRGDVSSDTLCGIVGCRDDADRRV